jgi:peroxin-14
VQRSPISQKQKFLRSKGLNEQEIQIACEQAGVFTQAPAHQNVVSMGSYPKNYILAPKQNIFAKIREILHSMALVSGAIYAVYWFYKVVSGSRWLSIRSSNSKVSLFYNKHVNNL